MPSKNYSTHIHRKSTDSGFLGLPSPYHSNSPTRELSPDTPYVWPHSRYLSLFPWSNGYARSSSHQKTDSDDDGTEGADGPSQNHPRRSHRRHIRWADAAPPPAPRGTNWLPVACLLLLLSLATNAFFFAYLGGERRYATVPHDAFRVEELGRNYTCYHEREEQFYRVDRFESVAAAYDHYWRELLGGSNGYVYQGVEAAGEVREARFGMFHQLDCLYRIRKALRATGMESKRKDFVVVGEGKGDEERWGHCFDYLRQVVLCGADDTVEVSDGGGRGWDGFGYGRRQCRDPGWLFDVTKCGRRGCKGGPFYHG